MATKTEICNRALIEIGEQPVTAVPGTTTQGQLCDRVYDDSLAEILEDGPELGWKFANKRVQISVNAVTPDFGFLYRFQIPADSVKVLVVGIGSNNVTGITTNTIQGQELTDWVREGDFIMTSQESTKVNMVYGSLETDTGKFSATFRKYLMLTIAETLAHRITADTAIRDRVKEDLRIARVKSFAVDGEEKFVREENDDWQDAGHTTEVIF